MRKNATLLILLGLLVSEIGSTLMMVSIGQRVEALFAGMRAFTVVMIAILLWSEDL